MDEKVLIEQIRSGDQQSFRKLYELHQDRVYNTAYGFVHHTEDAQDITQEVFVELYHSLSAFRGDSSLNTWIYRITVNKSLNHLRKKHNRSLFSGFRKSAGQEQGSWVVELPDQQLNPADRIENKELQQQLQRAIDNLPEKQRIAFILEKLEDLSYKEIAQVMETSLSAVESLLFRARQSLQKNLSAVWKERK